LYAGAPLNSVRSTRAPYVNCSDRDCRQVSPTYSAELRPVPLRMRGDSVRVKIDARFAARSSSELNVYVPSRFVVTSCSNRDPLNRSPSLMR
jgi:phosphoribosyl 1,2-cyclic phosphodiesterase